MAFTGQVIRALRGPWSHSGRSRRASGSPSGQVKLIFLRHPAHPAAVLGHSVYVAAKSRPARDSLIRRINSLMARFNSLLGRNKFPVPMRRELGRKPLNLVLDSEPIVALGSPDEQNSLYFPS